MEIDKNEIFHPRIIGECLPLYNDGHFKHAALEGMKQVEMALREKGIAPKHKFGSRLINWVLGQGEHITLEVPFGDELQDEARLLFKGAFAYYRNYAAHDGINIDKKTCFRIMILSSELLDLLSASKRSFEKIGGIDGLIENNIFSNKQELLSFLKFLNGYQIIEDDASKFEADYTVKGFNKIQIEALFDFGLLTYDDCIVPANYQMETNSSTLIGEFKLTNEGAEVFEELENKTSTGKEEGG